MGWRETDRISIIAHRGSSGSAPENTLAAFRKALDDGADGIELDVRMSKDGELVVLHDRTVNRTTNGRGKVSDLTVAELRKLDAGSSEHVPTLQEVIGILPRHILLNIEVKTDGSAPVGERRKRPALEEVLSRVISESEIGEQVLVSSFDHRFLARFHTLNPEIAIGALYSPIRDFKKKPSDLCRRVGASVFTCSVTHLRKRFADDTRENDITLGCYGVNTRAQLAKAISQGVRIIITDDPSRMRREIK